MKKNSIRTRQITIAVILLLTAAALAGFLLYSRRRTASLPGATQRPGSPSASPSGHTEGEALPDPETPEGKMYYAFQKLLEQDGFRASTDATIKLNGKMIKGTRKLHADAVVIGASQEASLQLDMNTTTRTGKETTRSHSAYYQGWYCIDDPKKPTRTERSPESVLSMVTFISELLLDASGQIENLKLSRDGADTIYQFTLPAEAASDYFSQLIERAAMDTEELKNVTGEVTDLSLSCRIDSGGILTEQTATAKGEVSKSIFTIPAALQEATSFTVTEQKPEITPPNLKKYKIQK